MNQTLSYEDLTSSEAAAAALCKTRGKGEAAVLLAAARALRELLDDAYKERERVKARLRLMEAMDVCRNGDREWLDSTLILLRNEVDWVPPVDKLSKLTADIDLAVSALGANLHLFKSEPTLSLESRLIYFAMRTLAADVATPRLRNPLGIFLSYVGLLFRFKKPVIGTEVMLAAVYAGAEAPLQSGGGVADTITRSASQSRLKGQLESKYRAYQKHVGSDLEAEVDRLFVASWADVDDERGGEIGDWTEIDNPYNVLPTRISKDFYLAEHMRRDWYFDSVAVRVVREEDGAVLFDGPPKLHRWPYDERTHRETRRAGKQRASAKTAADDLKPASALAFFVEKVAAYTKSVFGGGAHNYAEYDPSMDMFPEFRRETQMMLRSMRLQKSAPKDHGAERKVDPVQLRLLREMATQLTKSFGDRGLVKPVLDAEQAAQDDPKKPR